ncbi:MAG TPA: FHIPEP family type III secretion protein, partial [Burkholderiaceae bacterium]|nr:FHIPEP family type III secretion protein [Burkholderiaceae bacterium]
EAKRRRKNLEMESKLHGSLDGAMKFVKGDAIAGIVIIVINLLGGLAIGVMMQDLALGVAMNKYSILTIGEGMVAQIPALLGAMAAGLIVTRSSDEDDKHLGDAIRKQMTAKPRVLLVAAGICLLMAVVPGFPAPVFIVLALIAGSFGVILTPSLRDRIRKVRNPAVRGLVKKLEVQHQVATTAPPVQRPAVALLLRLPSAMLATEETQMLKRNLEELLDDFQLNLGLSLPRIHLHGETSDATAGQWELLAYEVPIAQGAIARQAPHAALVEPVRQALRRNAPLFLGVQDTTNLLTRASQEIPDVVKELLRTLPLLRVAEVMRRLVSESVSIRNLRDILEALSEASQRDKEVASLTEFARIALRRQISHTVAPQGKLRAIMLQPQLEEMVRQAVRVSGGVAQLALDPETARRVSANLAASIGRHKPAAVLTAIDVRWHMRKLIEPECFDTPVLSYHELMPTLQLEVLDRVDVPGAPMLEAA